MNKIFKILLIINTSLFIISLAISFVLLFRPFYYYQINNLKLEQETGYSYNEIKESYDDVINYLTLNKDFKTGNLKYSTSGKNHFQDCKILFNINFIILGITTIILLIKNKYLNKLKIFNYNLEFFSGCLNIIIILSLLIISFIVGFNNIFDNFHKIFFFGKDNWLLSPDTDEIIKILPIEYFIKCAILLISIISIISITIIIKEMYNKQGGKNVFSTNTIN